MQQRAQYNLTKINIPMVGLININEDISGEKYAYAITVTIFAMNNFINNNLLIICLSYKYIVAAYAAREISKNNIV